MKEPNTTAVYLGAHFDGKGLADCWAVWPDAVFTDCNARLQSPDIRQLLFKRRDRGQAIGQALRVHDDGNGSWTWPPADKRVTVGMADEPSVNLWAMRHAAAVQQDQERKATRRIAKQHADSWQHMRLVGLREHFKDLNRHDQRAMLKCISDYLSH